MVSGEESLRIGASGASVEGDVVDHVATERGQGDPVDRLVVGRAGLGELPRDTPDLHDRNARRVHEHYSHLQDDLELVSDGVGGERVEGLGTVACLQQECSAAGNSGEIGSEFARFARENQWRQRTENAYGCIQFNWIGPRRLLDDRELTP
ncbi:unannotated protein [freshwater metagenome]|uniref:Unannotated protein n=1 Tax=freshwater metagenome TaxID=449393 RepID=A0A6J7K7J3_9ZZZZ